jgi:hypothetical protein
VAVLAYEVPLAPDAAARGGGAREVLLPLAERARELLVRAVDALPPSRVGHDPQSRQDPAWLEVRILLRHHRYAQEVLYAAAAPTAARGQEGGAGGTNATGCPDVPDLGDGPDGPDPRLAAAGAALDRHRDAVEAAEAAAAAARTPRIAPATAYALGVLHAGQRQEAEAARREFAKLWNQIVSDSREAAPQAL